MTRQETVVRALSIIYERKTALGEWSCWEAIATTRAEYARIIDLIRQNPDEYRLVHIRRI